MLCLLHSLVNASRMKLRSGNQSERTTIAVQFVHQAETAVWSSKVCPAGICAELGRSGQEILAVCTSYLDNTSCRCQPVILNGAMRNEILPTESRDQ
jgi:hypothetical protein